MSFYDLGKKERVQLVEKITQLIEDDFQKKLDTNIIFYFSDEDTYVRKSAYIAVGRIYKLAKTDKKSILKKLADLLESKNEKVRQTAINAAGEIGILDFASIEKMMHKGLFDAHHSVRNAVIGSIKKMGEKNPEPVLAFAKIYLHHPDKEIRREICHGIELRGRKYPQDILPLLKELQFDKTSRVANTLIHVLGQISYKKGCLQTVISELKTWQNKELVSKAIDEIIDVHERYKNFACLSQKHAIDYIQKNF